jgi:hypothetical protein
MGLQTVRSDVVAPWGLGVPSQCGAGRDRSSGEAKPAGWHVKVRDVGVERSPSSPWRSSSSCGSCSAWRSGFDFHGFSHAAPCGVDDAELRGSEVARPPVGGAVVLESAEPVELPVEGCVSALGTPWLRRTRDQLQFLPLRCSGARSKRLGRAKGEDTSIGDFPHSGLSRGVVAAHKGERVK